MTGSQRMPDAVDVTQASELTGLSKKAIRRRLERGTLGSVKVGGRRLILISELDRHDLLREGEREEDESGQGLSPDAPHANARPTDAPHRESSTDDHSAGADAPG